MIAKLAILLLYVLLVVGLGLYTSKRTNTVDDFVLGNRSVGPWMSAFSFGTTYFSAVLIIGFAGKVGWGFGLSALWIAVGNTLIGTYLAWKVLAPKTREMTGRLNVLTMPSFLEARYDSRNMKIVASLIIFIFFIPYTASVFMGLSYLFEQVFQIPYVVALLLMTCLTAVYLVLGGYLAVALIDFVQGLFMIAGIALMIYFVVGSDAVGGVIQGYHSLKAIDPGLISPNSGIKWVSLVSLIILTSLGTWGLPQMVQKFYGIKSQDVIPRATIVSTVFALIITGGAYYVGSMGHLFFEQLPLLAGKATPDLIMPMIFVKTLPAIIAVLILILVLSASMSTLSSLVLVASSSITIDLVRGTLFPEMDEKTTMRLMRILCVVFIVFSLYIAIKPPAIILTLMALSWGTVAGAFLAPYLCGLFMEKTTKSGAWAGLITGLAISLGGYFLLTFQPSFIRPAVLELLSGWGMPFFSSLAMLVPLVVIPLVSSLTKEYSVEHINRIFCRNEELAIEQQ
ncbi:MAG: sodium:solute symporter [Bacillota bacterium]|nr:sodium:solute symporter [Bacillota bacterium]